MSGSRRERFPTLEESKAMNEMEFDEVDDGLESRRFAEELERVNESMAAVLKENERLKADVKSMRGKLGGLTKAYNGLVDENKTLKKGRGRG